MARRFGRLWSSVLAIVLFFITYTTYYTLKPLRDASIVVEPESKVVLEDSRPGDAVVPETNQETTQSVDPSGTSSEGLNGIDDAEKKLHESEPGTETYVVPEAVAPTLKPPEPEPPEPEGSDKSADEAGGTSIDKPTENEDQLAGDVGDVGDEEPEPPPPSKIIVIGKLNTEETDWVSTELSDWQNAIYVVDLPPGETSPTSHRTKVNKAREAMPYLTYIIDNYPDFPDVVAFIHPHRRGMPKAWHNDARGNDAVYMMRDLRIETVLDRGYVNLRCNNEVGCPDEVQPFRDPPDPLRYAEHAFPYVYGHFFNATFTMMRETIGVVATQCCAQFAVSKDQLLKLPKYEYERYRTFLEETHYDDATSGRVMEYMWHIIFGRDAVHCENMFECWCAVYGRCFGHHRMGGGSSHP